MRSEFFGLFKILMNAIYGHFKKLFLVSCILSILFQIVKEILSELLIHKYISILKIGYN